MWLRAHTRTVIDLAHGWMNVPTVLPFIVIYYKTFTGWLLMLIGCCLDFSVWFWGQSLIICFVEDSSSARPWISVRRFMCSLLRLLIKAAIFVASSRTHSGLSIERGPESSLPHVKPWEYTQASWLRFHKASCLASWKFMGLKWTLQMEVVLFYP